MLDTFNIPTPQTANYQEFYGGVSISVSNRTWVKPRGVSMVRIMLIGGGGGGTSGSSTEGRGGGGSGGVTSWIGPAMFVPDILNIRVGLGGTAGTGGNPCFIRYQSSNGENLLLRANPGSAGSGVTGGAGGVVMTANQFAACGIFTSIAGQGGANGSATGAGSNVAVSSTTFLSGGAGGAGGSGNTGGRVSPNYDYVRLENTTAGGTVDGANGYFITQPILVGCGGAGGTTNTTGTGSAGGRGGIGCGGGGAGEDSTNVGKTGGQGGDGAVFIWAW